MLLGHIQLDANNFRPLPSKLMVVEGEVICFPILSNGFVLRTAQVQMHDTFSLARAKAGVHPCVCVCVSSYRYMCVFVWIHRCLYSHRLAVQILVDLDHAAERIDEELVLPVAIDDGVEDVSIHGTVHVLRC